MDYNEEAEYVTADELAECYRVGEELYIKLWEVTIANQKNDTRGDIENYNPTEWLVEAPNLLSKVWSAFTIDEKSKINDALENGSWSMTQQLDQREEQGL